ncbi:MAG: SprT family zinc-dependent metalloprotease [Pseudomonadota bacterium]
MAEVLEIGDPPVAVRLRRTARARRLSLRISGADGKVSLTVPPSVSLSEAKAFLRDKESWLQGHLSQAPELVEVGVGTVLPVDGVAREIVEARRRSVGLFEAHLAVPYGASQAGARVQAFLKTRARDRLVAACDHYAAKLGRPYQRITLRDTRTRWGSCSSEGNLMFSWRLCLAPPEVLDYVAAHEVAHLAEMNHSPQFWATVASLLPAYDGPRKWLRREGSSLHRYRFAGR